MSNLQRKANRKDIGKKKKEVENKLGTTLNMFDRLPDKCDACSKPFDKKSKEMAQTWVVVVRNEQKLVRLFCPACLEKVKEMFPDESEET